LGTPETIGSTVRLAMLIGVPLAVAAAVFAVRRRAGRAPVLTLTLNLIMLGLLIQTAVEPVSMAFDLAGRRPAPAELYPDLPLAALPEGAGPDVWNIVMDRYAGGETLQRVYGFDNEPFLAALEQRGFAVARGAAANYQRTASSLASSLNLDYLTPFAEEGRIAGYDEIPLYRTLQDSRASRFFAGEGYAVIRAGPWWDPTRHDVHETTNLNYADFPELFRLMLERSLLGHLAVATGMEFANGRLTQCQRTRVQFERLEAAAASPDRKFVFAHFLLPHPPYVLDAEGGCKSALVAGGYSRVENYLDQLRYANRRLLALLDRILSGPRPAVIILQADEGPWPAAIAGNERDIGLDTAEVDWPSLSRDQIREKLQILYALKFPDGPPAQLNRHASPVNALRLILNRYFGMAYPMLPDRNYLFRDHRRLYDFIDVTEAVQ
jgi:hypothetical protein